MARGFTLIEVLVVITILVILTGMVCGAWSFVSTKVATTTTEGRIHALAEGVLDALRTKGACPARLADLPGSLQAPQMLEDGWGRPLEYTTTGKAFRIVSAGPDGQSGTADDIEFSR